MEEKSILISYVQECKHVQIRWATEYLILGVNLWPQISIAKFDYDSANFNRFYVNGS